MDDCLRVVIPIILGTETGGHIERDDKGVLLIDKSADIRQTTGKASPLLRTADAIDDDRSAVHPGWGKVLTHLTHLETGLQSTRLGPGDHLRQDTRATVIEQDDFGSVSQHIECDCREQRHSSRHTRTGKDDQVLPRPQLSLQLCHEGISKPLRELMLIQGADALHSTGYQSLSSLIVEYFKHGPLSPRDGWCDITRRGAAHPVSPDTPLLYLYFLEILVLYHL